ncbi:MAG: hypothetical protein Q8R42_03685 [Desulfocapsaceae bacterium]|nr:hypothetical protein [Desulfocapsaceae bacterium]
MQNGFQGAMLNLFTQGLRRLPELFPELNRQADEEQRVSAQELPALGQIKGVQMLREGDLLNTRLR